jgi:2-oxoisovalerate dehydrogenase E2 component (dihydrolipoyl transacylase)
MTATIIELPQVGESVTEGIMGRWLKSPGDHVDKYEPLVEVMTDKVNMEVPSPFSGTLTKTLVEEGDTVPMGQAIAEMDVTGDAVTGDGGGPRESARSFEFNEAVRSVGPTGSGEGGAGRPDVVQAAEVAAHATARTAHTASSTRAQKLSPLVKRLVTEHSVDAAQIIGTGVGGRITKDDVVAYVELHIGEAKRQPGQDSVAASEKDSGERPVGEEVTLPLTPLRKTIAEHLTRSAEEIPAAWSMVEVDVTGLVECRTKRRDAFETVEGIPLTYLPFAAHAVVQALRDNGRVNGRWDGDYITLNNRIHLSIAVSTEHGLVVPVVHNADRLSITGLAMRISELTHAARSQKLKIEDVQGGTFTLNNTGALGSVISVPIINHPQAAIVTTEAIVKRPVVVEGDSVAVRSMMNVCMTFDHRVCDGAEAGAFLASFKTLLEMIDENTPLE